MIQVIRNGLIVLQKGKSLKDPAVWKNRTIFLNTITVILFAAVASARALGVEIPLTDEELSQLAISIVILVGVFNNYETLGTSDKVGIGSDAELPPVTEATIQQVSHSKDDQSPDDWYRGA